VAETSNDHVVVNDGSVIHYRPFTHPASRRDNGASRYKAPGADFCRSRDNGRGVNNQDRLTGTGKLLVKALPGAVVTDGHMEPRQHRL
jgi:hypothetical protein